MSYQGQIYYNPNGSGPNSKLGQVICLSPALTFANYATNPTGIVRNDKITLGNPVTYLDVNYAGLFHIPVLIVS